MPAKLNLDKVDILNALRGDTVGYSFVWGDFLDTCKENKLYPNVSGFYHDQDIERDEVITAYEKSDGCEFNISYPAMDRLTNDGKKHILLMRINPGL